MGWLRAPMKDFIQFCKSPNKKNNLISKASILLYSCLSPNLTALETIQYRPPCAFCWLPSCPIHPPSLPCVFGWLLCLFVDWGPPKTTTNFVFLIFLPPISMAESMRQRPPPSSTSCAPFHQTIFRRLCRLSVGCCVSPSTGSNRKSRPRNSLSIFIFSSLYSPPPNDRQTSSPTRSAQSRRLSNVPSTADIIVWLVVAFLHRMAATQDRCSAHLSIFRWVPLGRPNQGIPPQRAQARAFGA